MITGLNLLVFSKKLRHVAKSRPVCVGFYGNHVHWQIKSNPIFVFKTYKIWIKQDENECLTFRCFRKTSLDRTD